MELFRPADKEPTENISTFDPQSRQIKRRHSKISKSSLLDALLVEKTTFRILIFLASITVRDMQSAIVIAQAKQNCIILESKDDILNRLCYVRWESYSSPSLHSSRSSLDSRTTTELHPPDPALPKGPPETDQSIVPQLLIDHFVSMIDPSRAQTVDNDIARHCAFRSVFRDRFQVGFREFLQQIDQLQSFCRSVLEILDRQLQRFQVIFIVKYQLHSVFRTNLEFLGQFKTFSSQKNHFLSSANLFDA